LTAYNGTEENVTVPGTAVIDDVEYSRVQLTASVFRNKTGIKSLSFGQGVEFPEYAGSMFSGMRKLETIDLSAVNTTNTVDMSFMFFRCSSLNSLDLSSFNTVNVTSMDSMFDGCTKLSSLNLSSCRLSNVEEASDFLYECENLVTINCKRQIMER